MSQQEIKITIDKANLGSIEIEGMGYSGMQCSKDIEDILTALQGKVITRKRKPQNVRNAIVQKIK